MLSPTLVDEYWKCPWRFYLREIMKVEEKLIQAMQLGKMTHSACQEYALTGKIPNIQGEQAIRMSALSMLRQFRAMWKHQAKEVEKEIKLQFKDMPTQFHIDIVWDGGCTELKTSRHYGYTEKEIRNNIQFPMYCLAYRTYYGKPGEIECIVLGCTPKRYIVSITEQMEKDAIDKFYDTQAQINSGNYPQRRGWWCRHCGFYQTKNCVKGGNDE